MVTPPINENYWLMRVPLTKTQAVVIFPKFGTIGCGFQVEKEDWNTNLPISCSSSQILDHIWKNHGGEVTKPQVKEAIELLQKRCLEMGLVRKMDFEKMRNF